MKIVACDESVVASFNFVDDLVKVFGNMNNFFMFLEGDRAKD